MKRGWIESTLGEACELIMGQSPPSTAYNCAGNGLPFFQGKTEFGDLHPLAVKWCSEPNKIAVPGDVLLSVRAPVGPTNLADQICCIGRGLAAVRPKDGTLSKFVLYYLRSIEPSIDALGTGTTFKAVSGKVLRDISFPLAPLPEQRRIVAAIELQLGRLDAAVARLHAAKAKLKRYKQAVLKAAVEGRLTTPNLPEGELPKGWRIERLADIVTEGPSNGYSPKPTKERKGTKSLKLSATTSGRMILNEDTIKYIPEVVPKDSKYWLRAGDVLLQRANSLEYLGVAAMYTGGHHEYIYPDLMMRVRFDNQQLAEYIVQYLNSTTARQYFIKKATGTAGNMPKINGETVRELDVPVPSDADLPDLLAHLSDMLTAADSMDATLDAQLQQAIRLRQSVLQRAFEGRLVNEQYE